MGHLILEIDLCFSHGAFLALLFGGALCVFASPLSYKPVTSWRHGLVHLCIPCHAHPAPAGTPSMNAWRYPLPHARLSGSLLCGRGCILWGLKMQAPEFCLNLSSSTSRLWLWTTHWPSAPPHSHLWNGIVCASKWVCKRKGFTTVTSSP